MDMNNIGQGCCNDFPEEEKTSKEVVNNGCHSLYNHDRDELVDVAFRNAKKCAVAEDIQIE